MIFFRTAAAAAAQAQHRRGRTCAKVAAAPELTTFFR